MEYPIPFLSVRKQIRNGTAVPEACDCDLCTVALLVTQAGDDPRLWRTAVRAWAQRMVDHNRSRPLLYPYVCLHQMQYLTTWLKREQARQGDLFLHS